ncbi:MAG: hypothetical protein RLO51_28060 [Thalassobaculum sp.]|uniref:hypothetical protein n=1 Tax=Thalassobaculum sp. TaxID=2022740 RepID=UPI0032F03B22
MVDMRWIVLSLLALATVIGPASAQNAMATGGAGLVGGGLPVVVDGRSGTLPGAGSPEWFDTRSGRGVPVKVPDLAISGHKVVDGESVWNVLQRRGFNTNADLLGVVRALNPGKLDLDRLTLGEELLLPEVPGASSPRLTLVDGAKRARPAEVFADIRLPAAGTDPGLRVKLSELERSVSTIERHRADVPGDYLALMREQARAASLAQVFLDGDPAMLQALPEAERSAYSKLSPAELESLARSATATVDYGVQASQGKRPAHRTLQVRTVHEATGQEHCNLSIYTVSEFHHVIGRTEERKQRLLMLSSPASGTVPVSEIRVWAEWRGSVVSNRDKVDLVYATDDVRLDLPVRDGGECR